MENHDFFFLFATDRSLIFRLSPHFLSYPALDHAPYSGHEGLALHGVFHGSPNCPGIFSICGHRVAHHEIGRPRHGPLPDQIHVQCISNLPLCVHDNRGGDAGVPEQLQYPPLQ